MGPDLLVSRALPPDLPDAYKRSRDAATDVRRGGARVRTDCLGGAGRHPLGESRHRRRQGKPERWPTPARAAPAGSARKPWRPAFVDHFLRWATLEGDAPHHSAARRPAKITSNLFTRHTPPCGTSAIQADGRSPARPAPAGVHTDYGFMTILRRKLRPAGCSSSAAMRLADAPSIEGAYVVNIGDAFMRWTNDAWVSTPHRVANPPRNGGGSSRRQSIPFFLNPNSDTIIECLRSSGARSVRRNMIRFPMPITSH